MVSLSTSSPESETPLTVKIALFGKNIHADHLKYFKLLVEKLEESGCVLSLWQPFFEQVRDKVAFSGRVSLFTSHKDLGNKAELFFSVGGDGTLLDSIQFIRDSGIPVVGINLGRMGFLSSIARNDIIPAITEILAGEYRIDKRSLIYLESPGEIFGEMSYALNELSINKKETSSMVVVQVWVDDQYVNSYWADGLIVATPTGSTAYSLSCNGPIITPDSKNFVITPIAPHNLTVRPLVIPDSSRIRIRVDGREKQALIRLDSRMSVLSEDVELILRKADFEVNHLQRKPETFFSTIRAKLNWGMDIRN